MLNLNHILAKKSDTQPITLDSTGLGPPRKESLLQVRLYSSIGSSEPFPNNQDSKRKSDDLWAG